MSALTEIDASTEGTIKSVTVHRTDKAEIARTFELSLANGVNEIHISGLSGSIDQQSVRVSGLGSAAQLIEVVCAKKTSDPIDELKTLEAKRRKLQSELLVREQETEVYLSYAKSVTSEHVTTQDIVPFMQLLVQERLRISKTISSLNEQIRTVDDAIVQLGRTKASPAVGHVTLRVYVDKTQFAQDLSYADDALGASEPDEEWKKDVKDSIDQHFAPEIALLLEDKARKQSAAPSEHARIEQEYDQQLLHYISLANEKYEEKLASERVRRTQLERPRFGAPTTFTLTYVVSRASWKPLYDIHALSDDTGAASSVTLHYRASVTQNTGENWHDAPLVLSTATHDTLGAHIPKLPTYRVKPKSLFSQQPPVAVRSFGPPAPAQSGGLFGPPAPAQSGGLFGPPPPAQSGSFFSGGGAFGGGLFSQAQQTTPNNAASMFGSFGPSITSTFTGLGAQGQGPADPPPPAPVPVTFGAADTFKEPESGGENTNIASSNDDESVILAAKIHTTSLSVSYAVNHPVNIPSDGVAHTVSVTQLPMDAEISRVCVPRLQPVVYLRCKITNKSDYRLVAGPVNVFLDDSFVTRTSIDDVMPNDNFECALGADSALRVTYERLPEKLLNMTDTGHANVFGEQKRITKHVSRTYITNNHAHAVNNLIVRDALPLTADPAVKVTLRTPKGLAEAKAGQKVPLADNTLVRWSRPAEDNKETVEGRYEWLVNLEAGKGCTLETVWELQVPMNTSWAVVAETNRSGLTN